MDMKIIRAKFKELNYCEPIDFFEQYANYDYSVLLTGKGKKDISHYSYIGIFPHTILKYEKEKFFKITANESFELSNNFWEVLKNNLLGQINYDFPVNLCGWIGYFSYEMLHEIEDIEYMGIDNFDFPVLEAVFYNVYFIFDHYLKKLYKIEFEFEKDSKIIKVKKNWEGYSFSNKISENTKKSYLEKVRKIQDYILDGDVYEVNFTQQNIFDWQGNSYQFFKKIFKKNPAPFSAYLNFNQNYILSNSPEMFLKCIGKNVETRPIKGTAPRKKNEMENAKNKLDLFNSQKDQAELFMIVDLMRNDLNRVCRTGSVKVVESKRIETYENVFHLISIISGELKEEFDYIDLIAATFPGGSITGCPKIRCMEIIEELENFHRQLYTGTIFMMNSERLISNIVIRTAIIKEGKMYLNSGGAITIDSIPEDEYQESIHKLQNWFNEL